MSRSAKEVAAESKAAPAFVLRGSRAPTSASPPPGRSRPSLTGYGGEGWDEGGAAEVSYSCPSPLTPTLSPPGRGSAPACVALLTALATAAFYTGAIAQPAPPAQQSPAKMTIGFVEIAGDPRHEPL